MKIVLKKLQRCWRDENKRTILLANLAGILDPADASLLPGVYREIGLELGISPTKLGSLSLFRSLTQTLCFPLAAFLASHCNRTHVIALGALMWAIPTMCVGIASTFSQIAISNAVTGVGLALVVPAIQSLIADSTDDSKRGVAFGWLQLTGIMGSILGGSSSVLLASTTLLGISGWRVSFFVVGFISAGVGISVRTLAVDPSFLASQEEFSWHKKHSEWVSLFYVNSKKSILEARKVVGIQTFQVIVAQGVVGTFSGASLAFLAMWLELAGYTHQITALLLSIFSIASTLGGLTGGRLGDVLSTRLPNVGRIMLAQVGTSIGVPISAVLFLLVSNDTSKWLQRAVVFCILGFLTSWNATATNNPIFAEIVPSTSRTMIYALDRSFESLLASFAPTVVGLFAERIYGYVPIQKDGDVKSMTGVDQKNAVSLARALFTAYSIPYAMCCLIYSFLYCTYPKDRDKARAESYMGSRFVEQNLLHSAIVDNTSPVKKEETEEGTEGSEQTYSETELLLFSRS